jgi:hypothetical protein
VTDRFNFYDLYGYVLPGLTLLAVLWVPFGITTRQLPLDTASALATLAFSYVIGVLLHGLASEWIPGRWRSGPGLPVRQPSDLLLDENDGTFLPEVKAALRTKILKRFAVDLSSNPHARHREEAFLSCRAHLVQAKASAYAEQYQGMYALHRGVLVAFFLGLPWQLSWAAARAAALRNGDLKWLPLPISFVIAVALYGWYRALLDEYHDHWDSAMALSLASPLLLLSLAGAGIGAQSAMTFPGCLVAGGAGCIGAFMLPRLLNGFRRYATLFTGAVYRDFLRHEERENEA